MSSHRNESCIHWAQRVENIQIINSLVENSGIQSCHWMLSNLNSVKACTKRPLYHILSSCSCGERQSEYYPYQNSDLGAKGANDLNNLVKIQTHLILMSVWVQIKGPFMWQAKQVKWGKMSPFIRRKLLFWNIMRVIIENQPFQMWFWWEQGGCSVNGGPVFVFPLFNGLYSIFLLFHFLINF